MKSTLFISKIVWIKLQLKIVTIKYGENNTLKFFQVKDKYLYFKHRDENDMFSMHPQPKLRPRKCLQKQAFAGRNTQHPLSTTSFPIYEFLLCVLHSPSQYYPFSLSLYCTVSPTKLAAEILCQNFVFSFKHVNIPIVLFTMYSD